ncbi:hypothetical protein HPP92_004968 [Vanilla planifolia]|uniref:Uncharacterized protein n=1 Tax=Vanilla planifolia TaxID=51239 RepID=A0A835RFX9_VANPL|nr:hypothetical protein HPP92_004968 [Vanilla planifolia]
MNLETGGFARCVKHPSQFFIGFCSTCLVERLTNVDSVESTQKLSHFIRNGAEIAGSLPYSLRKNGDVRVRKTLLSLFKLEDLDELDNKGCALATQTGCNDYRLESALNFETGSKDLDDRSGSRIVSVSSGASGNASVENVKLESLNNGNVKENDIFLWLQSKIPMKGFKCRRSASMKGQSQDMCFKDRIKGKSVENKPDVQNSLYVRGVHDLNEVSWEKPRHSWDGSMMSKALTCSFSCLEERQKVSYKIKKSSPDKSVNFDTQTSAGASDFCKPRSASLPDHNPSSPDHNFGASLKEVLNRESVKDISISKVCRKKTHGWSRVWDWSIPSPFRDFSKRNGHVLERSLSESWRDNHKDINARTIQSDTEVAFNGNALSHASASGNSTRGAFAANCDRLGFRPEWQKMQEFKLSRSRSVHYSAPQNVDNGLLRFYLTPLRINRSNKVKCRRSSQLAKGFPGL